MGAQILIDKSRLTGRERTQHGNHGPPRNAGREGFIIIEQAQPMTDLIELLKTSDHINEQGIFILQMRAQTLYALPYFFGGTRKHILVLWDHF